MHLNSKRYQTYDEALKAMSDNTCPIHYLNEISTRHYTEKLLETAIRNRRCSLKDIPSEKRSVRLCRAVLETGRSEDVQFVPEAYFDFDFCLQAASCCPSALNVILYRYRKDRWQGPYTPEDVRIIAEAACPRERGQIHLDSVGQSRESMLNGRTFEEYCSKEFGYVHPGYADLYKKALDAYIAELGGSEA